MSLLKNLVTDSSIANEKDSVGGNAAVESGLYPAKIKLAYLKIADSKALGLVLHLETESDQEIRQTLWMSSGEAKGGTNYYTDKNGAKQYLPGFLQANSLALLTAGKEISNLDTEEKVINIYSSDAKAEVPTKVQMFTELLGQEVIAGVIKQTVDKTKKNESTGKYEPTGETREENEIDKFFRAKDKMTTSEIRAEAAEPAFYNTWSAKWTGKNRDKSTGGGGGTAGVPKATGAAAGGSTKPTKSLFG